MPRRLGPALLLVVALLALPAAASAQVSSDLTRGQAASTADRYSIVHGCFALRSSENGNYVARAGAGYAATAAALGGASPFRMQATDLGKYLLYDPDERFLAADGNAVSSDAEPSDDADWTVNESGGTFTFANEHAGRDLSVAGNGDLVTVAAGSAGAAGDFTLEAAQGCPEYPEIEVNATGTPSTGSPVYGEVAGTVEGHMHGMAFEFLGGDAHCGRPWHRFGAPYALKDCVDHETSNGCGAVLENVLYGNPARCHPPGGWPDFQGWPDPKSLTHEQTYYKWLERAYMGGLRLYVNLMVENKVLCDLYPLKHNSCNEMDSVLLQIQRIHQLEDYIDAQSGGPGEGWFRIVEDPFEARAVINEGKMAVVQGMEVSEPFNCSLEAPLNNPDPRCTEQGISDWVDQLYDAGLRQFEITNKFDNALTGVAGDGGEIGVITNGGNFLSTGRFWDLRECEDPENTDRTPTHIDDPTHNQDLIIGNGLDALLPPGTAPVYGDDERCNDRGLSDLGEHAINELMDHRMMFDPDHQSVVGRNEALDLVEEADYPGVFSSHSWSTPNATPRILGQGGILTPSASDAPGFIHKYDHIAANRDPDSRQYFGLGYGADQNGFASQPGPRGADAPNPVTYPFQAMDPNVTLDKQVSGQKAFDLNTEGVAHYGLYPDLWEDIRDEAGGQETYEMLNRGAEAYLQMWERVEGITEVRCDSWDQPKVSRRGFGPQLELGDTPQQALEQAGQPEQRERAWRWCGSETENGEDVFGVFNKRGKLGLILTTIRGQTAAGVGAGDDASELRGVAKRVTGKIWVRGGGKHRFAYVVRGGEVVAVGSVSHKVSRANKRLRRNVKLAALPQ
jgi:hypothetical protein